MSTPSSLTREPLHIQWQGAGCPLLLLHGWGMNGAVWQGISQDLAEMGFRIGLVDLPGFGHSAPIPGAGLEALTAAVLDAVPEPSHLLGWSLGGLVATQAALMAPERVLSLVTMASSPCFQAAEGWRGIKPEVLVQFADQLADDLPRTLDRFFALQAMGSPSAREDVRALRAAVAQHPTPDAGALKDGLAILADADLRTQLGGVTQPWLRLYGRLDGLVPVRTVARVDELASSSRSVTLAKAAHAPFISHRADTLNELKKFYLTL
ncbi:pimeloyl-ACP methyl ester esterase BioH [Marinobacter hydrocarbonoclasticus]|nr:pimeloyl-ACP methyl ester esterase BioH [Marinobacter nauticus]